MIDSQASFPPYEAPTLTVDVVLLQFVDDQLQILLVKRERAPFAGMRALPGVYNPRGETTRQAFDRALLTKAGVDSKSLGVVHQLRAVDSIARDPRGHAVSIVYVGLARNVQSSAGPTTEKPQFFPISALPKLAFDHAEIVAQALEYLKAEALHTNILVSLLPEKFTLTELQTAYEVILNRSLDKRNFRKKLTALDLVTATSDFQKVGAHRPAQLYRFSHSELTAFTQAFA